MRVGLSAQAGNPSSSAEEPYSGRNRTRGRATRADMRDTLKKMEGQESFRITNWVKLVNGRRSFRAGVRLQGRPKPGMGADPRKRVRGPGSGGIAGTDSPLW